MEPRDMSANGVSKASWSNGIHVSGLVDVEGILPEHLHWALSFNTSAILAKLNVN